MAEAALKPEEGAERKFSLAFVMGFFLPVPPLAGGATEKVSFNFARRFHALGHPVTIYSRKWPGLPDACVEDGITHIRVNGSAHRRSLAINLLLDLWWSVVLLQSIGRHDVIVTNTIFFPILYKLKPGKKAAVAAWVGRMPKGQMKLYGAVNAIIAPSEALAIRIQSENPALKDKILRIPYPIDCTELGAAEAERREPVTIGYVGRIHPEKGLDILIDAAVRLAALPLPGWRLLIAGPTATEFGGGGEDYLNDLQETIPAPLKELIVFLPAIYDSASLAAHYARIDIFCYPSRSAKGETFGVAPLEAMAAGSAVIVSDLDCFKQYLVPGENGLCFSSTTDDPAAGLVEKIAHLIRSPEDRRRLGDRAREDAAAYDYGHVALLLQRLLSGIIQR